MENRFEGVLFTFGVRQWFPMGGNFVLWVTCGLSEDIFDDHDWRGRGSYFWHLVFRNQENCETPYNVQDRPLWDRIIQFCSKDILLIQMSFFFTRSSNFIIGYAFTFVIINNQQTELLRSRVEQKVPDWNLFPDLKYRVPF